MADLNPNRPRKFVPKLDRDLYKILQIPPSACPREDEQQVLHLRSISWTLRTHNSKKLPMKHVSCQIQQTVLTHLTVYNVSDVYFYFILFHCHLFCCCDVSCFNDLISQAHYLSFLCFTSDALALQLSIFSPYFCISDLTIIQPSHHKSYTLMCF